MMYLLRVLAMIVAPFLIKALSCPYKTYENVLVYDYCNSFMTNSLIYADGSYYRKPDFTAYRKYKHNGTYETFEADVEVCYKDKLNYIFDSFWGNSLKPFSDYSYIRKRRGSGYYLTEFLVNSVKLKLEFATSSNRNEVPFDIMKTFEYDLFKNSKIFYFNQDGGYNLPFESYCIDYLGNDLLNLDTWKKVVNYEGIYSDCENFILNDCFPWINNAFPNYAMHSLYDFSLFYTFYFTGSVNIVPVFSFAPLKYIFEKRRKNATI